MDSPKFSSIMIILVVISMVVAIFGLAMGNFNAGYAGNISESQLDAYNKLNNVSQKAEEVKTSVEEIKEDSSVFDVIGAYFASGYKAFRVSTESFDAMDQITNQAVEDSPLGDSESIQIIRVGIGTILVIIVFIMIGLSLLFKWYV